MKEKRKIKLMKTRVKIFTIVLSLLACCAFLPTMQAQLPPEIPGNPDGCYPALTTAEGCNALHQLLGALGNTAVGWYAHVLPGDAGFNALSANVDAGFSVAVGYQALLLNTGGQNTAVGDNALAGSTTGFQNTALGDLAGSDVTTGSNIIAIGAFQTGVDSDLGELD